MRVCSHSEVLLTIMAVQCIVFGQFKLTWHIPSRNSLCYFLTPRHNHFPNVESCSTSLSIRPSVFVQCEHINRRLCPYMMVYSNVRCESTKNKISKVVQYISGFRRRSTTAQPAKKITTTQNVSSSD